MRIKHITLMAGPDGTYPAGTERDVDTAIGRPLIAGGYAVEIATALAPETAVAPAARRSTGGRKVSPPAGDQAPEA